MEPGTSSLNSHGLRIHYNQNADTAKTEDSNAITQNRVNTLVQAEAEMPQPVAIAEGKDQVALSTAAAQAAQEEIEKSQKKEKLEKETQEESVEQTKETNEEINEEEQEMIANMKKTIKQSSHQVAQRVNRKAFDYMSNQKGWINEDAKAEAAEFFTLKIPRVMAKNLSTLLNQALGLDDQDPKA